jgi:hypothetical protein
MPSFVQVFVIVQVFIIVRLRILGVLSAYHNRNSTIVFDCAHKFFAVITLIGGHVTVFQIEQRNQIFGWHTITDLPRAIAYGIDPSAPRNLPVFRIQIMAWIIIRLSLAGRSFPPDRSSTSMSLILSYCLSVIICRSIIASSMTVLMLPWVSVILSIHYNLQTPSR